MDTDSRLYYLDSHEAFFKKHGTLVKYGRNQYFIRADDPSPWVYFLIEGLVKISFTVNENDERIIGLMIPGTTFAQNKSFFEADGGGIEYTTFTPCTLYRAKREDFIAELKSSHVMTADYLQQLLRTQIYMLDRSMYMGESNVYKKMIRWLLLMNKHYGEETPDGLLITPQMTQATIGGFLHASRESVSTSLKALIDKKLISVKRKRITIKNIEGLRALLIESRP